MASMVNRPLGPATYRRHVAIFSINKIHGEFGIRSSCKTYLFTAFVWLAYHTAHRLPCTRWAGLTGRHLLEFK